MLSVNQAEKIILDLVKPITESEIVKLVNGHNRILAVNVSSKLDFPYWDNSAMDGYAVKYVDVKNCSLDNPIKLDIVEEIRAGYTPKYELKSGQAARIFTGAMLPQGADTVVMQENTKKEGNLVKILVAPKPQEFVRHKGSFYQSGRDLLTSGIKIDSPEMAILATAQSTKLTVFRKPKVAIFSTGDELITPEKTLQSGQIIDSNKYLLISFITQNNGIPIDLGIVPDRQEALKNTISQAIQQADCVLSTGGVSVGEYDYVDQILTELGAKIQFRNVAIKPGKPLTFATFDHGCLYFGIPGNPVSTMVTCWRFVQSALQKLSGLANNYQPIFVNAKTRHNLHSTGQRETYLWGKLFLVNGEYEFELATGFHNSANLINLAETNGLAVVPVGTKTIAAENYLQVMQVNKPIVCIEKL
jgi:molybdopterin molybdotransferase